MEPSNISTRPFCEHTFRSFNVSIHFSLTSVTSSLTRILSLRLGISTATFVSWWAPLVSKNALDKSTIFLPLQDNTSLGSSVTTATFVASKFSSAAYPINSSTSFGSTTTAIRSWDSEIAISVPSSPAYFFGTLSRSTWSPSASSPIATETPPAPKSLHFLINLLTSSLRNSLWILRSVGGLPFCTSAPHVSIDSSVCTLEDPVAPPQPSRPVRPPSRIMISPGSEVSRITARLGAAPRTAPISIRFAT